MADNEDYNEVDEIDENQIIFRQGDGVIEAVRNGEVIGWVMASDGPGSKAPAKDSDPLASKDSYFVDSVDRAALRLVPRDTSNPKAVRARLSRAYHHGTMDERKAALMLSVIIAHESADGGPGSGNFGHKGRPGQVGGSGKGGGSGSSGLSAPSSGATRTVTKKTATADITSILTAHRSRAISQDEAYKRIKDIISLLPPQSSFTIPPDKYEHKSYSYEADEDGNFIEYIKQVGKDKRFRRTGKAITLDQMTAKYFGAEYLTPTLEKVTRRKVEPVVPQAQTTQQTKTQAISGGQTATAGQPASKSVVRYSAPTPPGRTSFDDVASHWDSDSLTSYKAVKLKAKDLDAMAENTWVQSSDGKSYMKVGNGRWLESGAEDDVDSSAIIEPSMAGNYFEVAGALAGLNPTLTMKISKAYTGMPDSMRELYTDTIRTVPFVHEEGAKSSCFYSDKHYININAKPDNSAYNEAGVDAFFHEFAHAIDDEYCKKGEKPPSVMIEMKMGNGPAKDLEDFEAMAKAIKLETDGKGHFKSTVSQKDIESKLTRYSNDLRWDCHMKPTIQVCDAISALTACRADVDVYSIIGGHKYSYWHDSSSYKCKDGVTRYAAKQTVEYWANYCALKVTHNEESLRVLKKITPNRYAACEATFKEVFGDG